MVIEVTLTPTILAAHSKPNTGITMNGYLKKLIGTLVTVALIVAATGCASYNVVKLGNIDSAQKTITVPAIGFSMAELKLALISDDWKLKASADGTLTEGTNNSSIEMHTKTFYKTRYRMTVEEEIRMSQWVLKTYISIIDNNTNEEVLSITGDSNGAGGVSPSTTAKKLMAAIKDIER